MSHVTRGVDESNRRRRGRALPLALAAFPSVVVALFAVGLVGVAVTIVVTIGLLGGLLASLFAVDRRRRARRLLPGEFATAGATIRAAEFVRAHPGANFSLVGSSLLLGDLTVAEMGMSWRPRPRFYNKGARTLTWTWNEVSHVETQRLRGWPRCDAIAVVRTDGTDVIVYVTDPAYAEAQMSGAGARVEHA